MDMPVMSGQEVCQRLKAQPSTEMVPIIMFTGNVTIDKVEQLDAGADDYLPKSNDLRELLAKVRVFLRIKRLQDRLHEQNERLKYENEKNERELQMAREVQLGLVPQEGGRRGRLDVAFRYIPMGWVGGDLFDVVENADGSTTFFISDVSGHGVGSAFVTAMIKTSILAYSSQSSSISDLVCRVNDAVDNLMLDDMFVTAFFGILDADAKNIEFVNAGHLATLLLPAGTKVIEQLESTQVPLGVMEGLDFEAEERSVNVGDRLILYTDGIIEAPNQAGEQFGMARFEESVLSCSDKELGALVEGVIQDLIEFSGNDTFDDDVNLVVCEVVEP
jgi:sigma-B regulation protein RsbU (phosphoserine phosphatase)